MSFGLDMESSVIRGFWSLELARLIGTDRKFWNWLGILELAWLPKSAGCAKAAGIVLSRQRRLRLTGVVMTWQGFLKSTGAYIVDIAP